MGNVIRGFHAFPTANRGSLLTIQMEAVAVSQLV